MSTEKDGNFFTNDKGIDSEMAKAAENPASAEIMLQKAEGHIQKLEMELKAKHAECHGITQRANFYEQLVKNLTKYKP